MTFKKKVLTYLFFFESTEEENILDYEHRRRFLNGFGILADLCQAVGFDGQGSGKAKNKFEGLEGPDVQFGCLREGDGR